MMEYAPDAPEFDWWEVHGKHEFWRVGQKITLVREGWSWRWKVAVLAVAVVVLGWSSFDVIWRLRDGELGSVDLILAIAWLLAVSVGAFAVVLWTMGSRRITIDWDGKQILAKRGIITRRYPLSDLERLELRAGPSRLVETAELVLVLKGTQLQLLETYYEEDPEKRFGKLATVARRLSDCLHVPLKRPAANDASQCLGMTDQELAEKYIKEGGTMEMHASSAEMEGNHTAAERYREEAKFLYRSAHDLDADHNEPLLALGRLSGDDELHRRAVDIAVGEGEDDVDALLARARLHHGDGEYELCLADLDRAVELELSARTLNDRGMVLYFQGRLEDALQDFERAASLEPGNARMHEWRSNCWQRIYKKSGVRRHRQNALDAIDQAIELDPENTQYRQDRSKLLAEDPREYEQAVAELDRQCADHPDDFMVYKNRGELHLEQRDGAAAAIRDFTKMIEILEKQPIPSGQMRSAHMSAISMAYRLRSEAHRAEGDFLAADRDLTRANELEPMR